MFVFPALVTSSWWNAWCCQCRNPLFPMPQAQYSRSTNYFTI